MQKTVAVWLALCAWGTAGAQQILSIVVKDKTTNLPLSGASVVVRKQKVILTDSLGYAKLSNLPIVAVTLEISYTGYQTHMEKNTYPFHQGDTLAIFLEAEEEALEEVVIQSTRTSRTISNTPTRVEVIDGEELDEKSNMRPANISMLLHESTGLQVQQTSATSANASIRVQGLDGRYTQLLKDGYPNFGGFAGGLSILEIPPLDLKQVEVIKGPSSTLYGGGAIAGVVNLISKTPSPTFEGNLLLNQSNIGQTNVGGFVSQKKGRIGFTLLALYNFQKAFDVDSDGFSELPKSNNFSINPRLFVSLNETTALTVGHNTTQGEYNGGDMLVIGGKPDATHVYFEKNSTIRNNSTLELEKQFGGGSRLKLKQSISWFDRKLSIPDFVFAGLNTNAFSDVSFAFKKKNHNLIAGLNLVFDKFKQKDTTTHHLQSLTLGGYLQDTWDINEKLILEGGLRIDHLNFKDLSGDNAAAFVLPKLSLLYKANQKINLRVGGGLGYKTPTIFTEQTESTQYQNLLALSNVKAEKSAGLTADFNYRTNLAPGLNFSVNQLFFLSRIARPLVLTADGLGSFYFANQTKPVISSGFETNVKFIYKQDLKLFIGYTFTNAKAKYLVANQFLPLVPKSKLNLTLMYEKEDNFKLGLEGYYTGRQYLANATKTPAFWEFGFMAQKTFGKLSFYINLENFTDQRQSNYKAVVNPPFTTPSFDEIWNHTEGFVVNGGLKLKL